MSTFNVIINGVEMTATGSKVSDVSTSGKPFTVVMVDSLIHNGKDVRSFLKVRDNQLRAEELSNKQTELDKAWNEALTKFRAENPDATADSIEEYKRYWMTLPANRKYTSNLTNGLSATIIDPATGESHMAYFMRESTQDAPRFRTFIPKPKVDLESCPF